MCKIYPIILIDLVMSAQSKTVVGKRFGQVSRWSALENAVGMAAVRREG
jgi:hypothetical protein